RPITFRNIPRLEKIIVHTVIRDPDHRDSAWLHVAGMIVQAITNVRCQVYKAKHNIANFGLRASRTSMAVGVELRGEDMYCFLSKVVEVVMPKIKEYKGVSGGSGDSSGNLAFSLGKEARLRPCYAFLPSPERLDPSVVGGRSFLDRVSVIPA
ncbi:MAG: hypothetical protein Q9214_002679, partial [Letrouitia sp. 1 TL-2023]